MSNIVFFGASVTQQKEGYVHFFDKLVNRENYNLIQRGYGSMHLDDAGICFIDDIILENPNYCYIDWFSTGFIAKNEKILYIYLDVIVRKLLLINCKIVFLLFDRADMSDERLKMYNNVILYANKYNIDYIELYNNENISDLLRDNVHTTILGSQVYGTKIYEHFLENIINKDTISLINIPLENKYSDIKKITVDKVVNDNIILKGDFEIVGIYQTIGPFSGLCEIDTNGDKKIFNIWDQWCRYKRKNIKITISERNQSCKIKVLQDSFDTTLCKIKDICFDSIKKYMEIHYIFYIGELEIDSIDNMLF